MKRVGLFFLLTCLFACPLLAQYTITGKVISNDDRQPIAGVTITVGMDLAKALTDSNGVFNFNFHSQGFLLTFSHVGYETRAISFHEQYKPGTFILTRSSAFLSTATVLAYERNTKITNIPVAIGLLGKKELERYNNTSLVPAVNTIPGVKMDERSPGSYRLSIRGNLLRSPFGVRNVKVYWNGIPFTDANGNTYINQVGFNNVGKIEIIKGPGGSLYGAGTGGVILLTGRVAAANEKSIVLNSSFGSYGSLATDIVYLDATKDHNMSLTYGHQQSDGYRVQSNMRRDVVNYTGSFEINNHHSINANLFYSDLYYQTPGGLTQAQVIADPRQARPTSGVMPGAVAQKAALYLQTFYAGVANEFQFDRHWSNTTSIYFANTHFRNPTIRNYERKTEQGVGGRTVVQYKSWLLKLNAGGEYQYSFTNTNVYGNKSGNADTLQYHDKINAVIYNIFAQADIDIFNDFVLNAGLSYNNYHYGYTRLTELPAAKSARNFKPELLPRISILGKIYKYTNMYVSISKGFSPPSIDEVHASDGKFNQTLNAETGTNYELGMRSELLNKKLFIDASYYIFGLKNTIVSRRDATDAEYFVNAGKTKQKGFEFAMHYYAVRDTTRFFKTIKPWLSFTNIRARFTNYQQATADYSGNKLTGTSPNVFVAGIDIETRRGLYAYISYSYTDKLPLNDANTFFASSYQLFFGKIGYALQLSKKVTIEGWFAFDKSFNQPYSLGNDLNAASNRFFNPAAPRNYNGGISIRVRHL